MQTALSRLMSPMVLLVMFLLTLLLGYINHYSHSELWAITTSQYFFNFSPHTTFIYAKPLFNFLLSSLYWFDLRDLSHLQMARGLFALFGAFNLFMIYLIAKSQVQSKVRALWFLGFILSFHVVFTQCFRVRSDLLSLSFFLPLLFVLLNQNIKEKLGNKIKLFLPLLTLLCFLSTPKAIYMVLMAAGLYWIDQPINKERVKTGAINFIIPVLLMLSVATLVGEVLTSHVGAFTYALHYYFQSFSTQWLMSPFAVIEQSLLINSLNWLVILVGIGFCFKTRKQGQNNKYLLLSVMTLFFLLIHPERWEFFIAAMIPGMSFAIFPLLQNPKSRQFLYGLTPLLLILPLWLTYGETWVIQNHHQRLTILSLNEIAEEFDGESYFDSTGVLPRQEFFPFYFDDNNPSSNQNSQEKAQKRKPGMVFLTAKMQIGGGQLLAFLLEGYEDRGGGFWLRKDLAEKSKRRYKGLPLNQVFNYTHRPFIRGIMPKPRGLN